MKLILLFLLMSFGIFTHAQEGTLIEKLLGTESFTTAADRGNTHFVVLSGAFREFDHPGLAPEQIELKRAAYIHDAKEYVEASWQQASRQQGVKNPHMVIIVHTEALPGVYDGLIKGNSERLLPGELSELLKRPRYKNVQLITQKDVYSSIDYPTDRYVPPLMDAMVMIEGTVPGSTINTYVMGANAEAIMTQIRFGLATLMLELGERSQLGIRISGDSYEQRVVIPRALDLVGDLKETGMKVKVFTPTVYQEGMEIKDRTPGQAMELAKYLESHPLEQWTELPERSEAAEKAEVLLNQAKGMLRTIDSGDFSFKDPVNDSPESGVRNIAAREATEFLKQIEGVDSRRDIRAMFEGPTIKANVRVQFQGMAPFVYKMPGEQILIEGQPFQFLSRGGPRSLIKDAQSLKETWGRAVYFQRPR